MGFRRNEPVNIRTFNNLYETVNCGYLYRLDYWCLG